ncbi:anoctamin family protein [Aspergillus novofumigatus IBT 16806]|uniref:Putative stress response protein n=1 Tax=Aspergillus novofumigatus (strain IBT 16806) TaxID=1392255 RepID=A0A2I1C711_ASPN1|nr:putative stress response protein [Aspergillus novofumigatus IBT 16806]PKX93403.1 putative stress response protein [Aspergillus novofumigatus IBT 16806]
MALHFFHNHQFEHAEFDNLGVDWVIHYQFEEDTSRAIEEFQNLIHDLKAAQLQIQVRHGYGSSLLVCVRVPRDYLGRMIQESRVKDWLYGIVHELPVASDYAEAETPAEELRSVYHAVTWQRHQGGAGITPRIGKWKNIASAFPLHDQAANSELLRNMSRSVTLTDEDLDAIRALFGEKTAFYFAFIHCYSSFLVVPAVWGVICWLYFGPYSVNCAVVNCLWCIVFVEYWKIRETDLSLQWNVKGVGALKVSRPQYVWDKEVQDPITGETVRVFSMRKQLLRQLLLIPFATVATVALGTLIVVTFALEVFISEVYVGPLKGYLEFLPTVLFSLSLPTITSKLTEIATQLTEYENYRTQDQYDLAQTAKTFVMNFITAFLPTLLTAFVYVPFGAKIIPYLDIFHVRSLHSAISTEFQVDTSRFQQEVIYLSVTGQVLSFGEEVILPYVKKVLWRKWRDYRLQKTQSGRPRRHSKMTDLLLIDSPSEAAFLTRIRNEAEADEYNVHEDTLEMCVQYGYLALFGTAWPLVPLLFLINNWLELRGDFFKLTLECQRPPPIRADSIGPSLQGLEFLTWLGTLSTASIIYLYRDGMKEVHMSSLLLVLFIAQQVYLAVRFAVRTGLQKLGSGTLRREAAKRYAVRKTYLETFCARRAHGNGKPRVRFNDRVDVYSSSTDPSPTDPIETKSATLHKETAYASEREAEFWEGQRWTAEEVGVKLIKALSGEEKKRE